MFVLGFVFSTSLAQKRIPDFAYPQDVINYSEKDIDVALSEKNDTMLISAIVQYAIAESAISNDNFQRVVTKIDSALNITASRPIVNALLLSFKAQIFTTHYNNNLYQYRNRIASADTPPNDVNEWSDEQIRNYITDLLNQSIADKDILIDIPLLHLGSTVEYNEWGLKICPDIYRFLLNRADDIYSSIHMTNSPYLSKLVALNDECNNEIAYLYYMGIDFRRNMRFNTIEDYYIKWVEFYKKHSDSQFCGLLFNVFETASFSVSKSEALTLFKLITDFKLRYPDYPFMSTIENIYNNITAHNAMCSMSQTIAANTPTTIDVSSENVNQLNLCVYRCPDNTEKYKLKDCTLLYTIPVSFTDTIPFYNKKCVELPPLDYGKYVLVINSMNDKQKIESRLQEFRVTDMQMLQVRRHNNQQTTFMVVNGTSGKPMHNVTIKQYLNSGNNPKFVSSQQTGKDYSATFKVKPNTNYQYFASYNNDKYGTSIYDYNGNTPGTQIDTLAIANTDLGVYRPGATLKFAITAYSINSDNRQRLLVADTKLTCVINNASGTPIDTLTVTTDFWGRASTEYTLPKDAMNGYFYIRIFNNKNQIAYKEFQVAEYKAPTFYVEFDKTPYCFPYDIDTVLISGKVCTYSGVPLSNSNVKGELKVSSFGWNFSSVLSSQTISSFTDNKGVFKLKIPKSEFAKLDSMINDQAIHYRLMYNLSVSCTTQSGETQSNSVSFAFGKMFNAQFLDTNIEALPETELPIMINSFGFTDNDSIFFKLTNNETKKLYSGFFKVSDKIVNLSEIPSGEYLLEIFSSDKSDEHFDFTNVVIYRTNDEISPVKSALWVPVKSLNQHASGSVSFIAGSDTDTYIYYVAYTEDGEISNGWIEMPSGQHILKISLPKSLNKKATILLHTVKDYKTTAVNLSVKPYITPENISLFIESFRDKVTSGDTEHWCLKVTDQKGNPVESAIILNVYNAAIEAIRPNSFSMNFRDFSNYNLSIYSNYKFRIVPSISWTDKNQYKTNQIFLPQLYTYGISNIIHNKLLRMAAPTVKNVGSDYTYAAAKMESADVMARGAFDDAIAQEIIEEEADAGTITDSAMSNVQLREGELANALWRPYLSTSSDGSVSVDFEVPNYNTQWIFAAIAYNANLCTASLSKKFEVSKPIMVQPNLPRFLRNGDDATLSSLIINNIDSEQKVNVKVEIYNPLDSFIYLSSNKVLTLAPGENLPYSIAWKVPDKTALIGYRIIVANSKFSDGEQNVIPILDAVAHIIEAQTFYINPREKTSEITLNDYPENSHITLSYCDNPAWLCISALPSIFNTSTITAISLTNTLFSAFTARGIANHYKSVEDAITYWESHPQDSMLISLLSKNNELKIGSLSNSPWISAANMQTLQMQSISKLLDKQYIDNVTTETLSSLKALQNANGSFSWFRNSKGSFHITVSVLQRLGELNEMGYLPTDNESLNSLITKALNYLDREVINLYNMQKNKKDYSVFQEFAYTRALFPHYGLSKTLQDLTGKGLNQMLSSWKSNSLTYKARLIIMLCHNDRRSDAMPIYKSILQYAIHTPDKGTYWDNLGYNSLASTALILRAITTIDPTASIIDEVRQWLLFQKQTNHWEESEDIAKAIYSLMSSGTDWMRPSSDTDFSISLGEKVITKNGVEKFTGSLLRDIDIASPASKLSISRLCSSPAWGAVIARYSVPIDKIKSADINGLSLTKKLYDINGNQLLSAKNFRVGDKIRVMLTVKTKQDMDYVMINDNRSAAMEPVNQLSEYTFNDGEFMYREIKDDCVNFFIPHLPKGTHTIYYDVVISAPGVYSVGVASIQSQLSPEFVAHSDGSVITIISESSRTE